MNQRDNGCGLFIYRGHGGDPGQSIISKILNLRHVMRVNSVKTKRGQPMESHTRVDQQEHVDNHVKLQCGNNGAANETKSVFKNDNHARPWEVRITSQAHDHAGQLKAAPHMRQTWEDVCNMQRSSHTSSFNAVAVDKTGTSWTFKLV